MLLLIYESFLCSLFFLLKSVGGPGRLITTLLTRWSFSFSRDVSSIIRVMALTLRSTLRRSSLMSWRARALLDDALTVSSSAETNRLDHSSRTVAILSSMVVCVPGSTISGSVICDATVVPERPGGRGRTGCAGVDMSCCT